MIFTNKRYVLIKPETKSDLVTEFNSCFSQLSNILKNSYLTFDSVVKQTIFINARSNDEYRKKRDCLKSRLTEYYGTLLPPTSYIGQQPEDQRECAMELVLFKEKQANFQLNRKKIDDVPYCVVNYSGSKEVYAGGLTAEFNSYDTLQCSQNAFDLMERILKAEKLTFGDIVRQWNYIEGIIDRQLKEDGIRQNYQIFNDVRSSYYSKANFNNGYPAATGIGMNTGGVILEFIAVKHTSKVNIIPIKNPGQVDAHRYSEEVLVGTPINEISCKTSPKFERAKYATINNLGQIFISGTAAIRGQKSSTDQNAKQQTITTIENIQELISDVNLLHSGIELNSRPLKLSYLRAYVKEEKDIDDVKEICEKYYPDVPALYLISDICRDDLLMELEGIVDW